MGGGGGRGQPGSASVLPRPDSAVHVGESRSQVRSGRPADKRWTAEHVAWMVAGVGWGAPASHARSDSQAPVASAGVNPQCVGSTPPPRQR